MEEKLRIQKILIEGINFANLNEDGKGRKAVSEVKENLFLRIFTRIHNSTPYYRKIERIRSRFNKANVSFLEIYMFLCNLSLVNMLVYLGLLISHFT